MTPGDEELAIAARIKSERLLAGISLTDFAKRVGEHRSNYCNFESGKRRVSIEKMRQFASQLGMRLRFTLETSHD